MKAKIGKRYAQIIQGKCHWKFDISTLPEWQDDAFQVIDITRMNPEPVEGAPFDGTNFGPYIKAPSPPSIDLVIQIQNLSLAKKQELKLLLQAILQS